MKPLNKSFIWNITTYKNYIEFNTTVSEWIIANTRLKSHLEIDKTSHNGTAQTVHWNATEVVSSGPAYG